MGHNMKGNDMKATHETYSEKAGVIGAILSDLELLASMGVMDNGRNETVAILHACQIMASRAQEVADSIQHDAMAAQKAEGEQ